MNILEYTQAFVSTLFRATAYIFLEVVPIRIGKPILSVLFSLYLLLAFLQPSPGVTSPSSVKEESANADTKTADVSEKPLPSVPPPSDATPPQASPLQTILFSLPSPSRGLRILNLAINILLFAAAVDFVAYPFFDDASDVVYSRLGAVYPDAAKIVVRYPRLDATENVVRIVWRQTTDPEVTAWTDGPVVNLTNANDWVSTVKLDGLWPSTTYEYQLQDINGTLLSYPANPIHFRTFPDPLLHSGSHFRFLASSCVTPNFPYRPLQGRRIKGFELLADYVWPAETPSANIPTPATASETTSEIQSSGESPSSSPSTLPFAATSLPSHNDSATSSSAIQSADAKPPTEFMIFMGDFIYADVPIYYGDDKETYRRLYRRNYQSDSFRKVYERLPIFHTYDDHEIINNYAGQANDSAPPFPNANDAFELYNARANFDSPVGGQHYYDFRYGDAAFFVMDTRRYRSIVEETDESSRTMLGDTQLATFYDWLSKVNNTATFKFIVSSVPFTSLWQHDAQIDSWAGFAQEKSAILSALHSVPNVIILSGDRHEFAAIEFNGGDASQTVLEISTSPLSMFYVPFFRTLKMASEGVANKTRQAVHKTENGTMEVIEIVEELPQERVLKYIGEGNYKWSSIEVDTRDQDHPMVQIEIIIDGAQAYSLTIEGRPVKSRSSTALGTYVPQGFIGVLDMIGLKPSRWF